MKRLFVLFTIMISGSESFAAQSLLESKKERPFVYKRIVANRGFKAPSGNLSQRQLASLKNVFFRGNPMPPKPSNKELKKAEKKIKRAAKKGNFEAKELMRIYPKNPRLWFFAMMDTDGDGVRDFRIIEYMGKFFEGDRDVDGDGVLNSYDRYPFNPNRGGTDTDDDGVPNRPSGNNYIPKHLKWTKAGGKSKNMVRLQRQLFKKNKIILMERGIDFQEATAQVIYDVIQVLYAKSYVGNNFIPSLRKIVVDDSSLLSLANQPESVSDSVWEEALSDYQYTAGEVVVQNQSVTLYDNGTNMDPMEQLSLVSHEVGHSFSYNMDYDKGQLLLDFNYYAVPNYYNFVEKNGWTYQGTELSAHKAKYKYFTPQYGDKTFKSDYRELFHQRKLKYWYDFVSSKDLSDPEVKDLGITGTYSVVGAFEWFPEMITAYFLSEIEIQFRKLKKSQCKNKSEVIKNWEIENQELWNFRFQNIRGSEIYPQLRKLLPLRKTSVRDLSLRYLRHRCKSK